MYFYPTWYFYHSYIYITFTFMHLADAFIQSDLHCIQVSFTFDQLLLSLGIEPMILALLVPCSTIWATGKHSWKCFSKPYKNKMNSKSTFLWYFLFFMVATPICHWPDCIGLIALHFFCATTFLFIACGNTSKDKVQCLLTYSMCSNLLSLLDWAATN